MLHDKSTYVDILKYRSLAARLDHEFDTLSDGLLRRVRGLLDIPPQATKMFVIMDIEHD